LNPRPSGISGPLGKGPCEPDVLQPTSFAGRCIPG